MSEQRLAFPISPEAYHEWRNNPVTIRLLEDIEQLVIQTAFEVHATDSMPAFVAVRETIEGVLEWKPEELDNDEEEES